MGDVIFGNFRPAMPAPTHADTVVSVTRDPFSTDVLVWVINPNDRTADVEIGRFEDHRAAVDAAASHSRFRGLQVIDHAAVPLGGVLNLRPVATEIHVYQANGRFNISVRPSAIAWSALAGSYDNLDVAGDRAVELSEALGLPIVDHVLGAAS